MIKVQDLEKIVESLVNNLVDLKVVNEDSLRDYRIKKRFGYLREEGIRYTDAITQVAEEFTIKGFPMCSKNVERIIKK